jgi:hypothetical protein
MSREDRTTYRVYVDAETASGMESVFVGVVRDEAIEALRASLMSHKSIWIESPNGELSYIPHSRIYRVRFVPEG